MDNKDFHTVPEIIKENGKYGLSDSNGKIIIEPIYDDIKDFSEGFAVFEQNGKYGLMDVMGNIILQPIYISLGFVNDGCIRACKEDKGWDSLYGFIDTKGNTVLPFEYTEYQIGHAIGNGLVSIRVDKKVGYMNLNKEIVIQPKYELAEEFIDGVARVHLNKKVGFINLEGKEIIKPKYNGYDLGQVRDGMIYVSVKGLKGFYNTEGKLVIKPQYKNAMDFENGKALVLLNGEEFYIDKNGNRI